MKRVSIPSQKELETTVIEVEAKSFGRVVSIFGIPHGLMRFNVSLSLPIKKYLSEKLGKHDGVVLCEGYAPQYFVPKKFVDKTTCLEPEFLQLSKGGRADGTIAGIALSSKISRAFLNLRYLLGGKKSS